MLRLVAPLLLASLATAIPRQHGPARQNSVASDAQISFAIENNYDDTGPGAKTPQHAFKTYNNLQDALIGYLDDKDTKLPEAERELAIQRLEESSRNSPGITRYLPKTVAEYTGYKEQKQMVDANVFQPVRDDVRFSQVTLDELLGPAQFRPVDTAPRYQASRPAEDMKKEYSYSYNVNDASTGDQKSAQEWRSGGAVRGVYSLRDADGTTRRVRYSADHTGFHATVEHQ